MEQAEFAEIGMTLLFIRAGGQNGQVRAPGLGGKNVETARLRIGKTAVQKRRLRQVANALKQFAAVRAIRDTL